MENSKFNIKNFRVSSKIDTRFHSILDMSLLYLIVLSTLIFILWPIAAVLIKSVFQDGRFTLSLYKNLFTENIDLLINSLFVSTLSTIFTIIFALSTALYVSFSKTSAKKFINGVLLLTMISPPFVSSLAYITLFGRRGYITHKLLHLSLNPYGWHGIVLMQTFSHISLSALIIIGVIKGIDKNLIQASFDLGENAFNTLKRIVIPLAKPGIIAAAFITFVKCLSDFGTPIIIGGKFNVLATEAYLTVIGRGNLPKASAMSVLILLPALIVFLIYHFKMKDLQLFSNNGSKSMNLEDIDFKLRGFIKIILAIITWIFLIFMLLQYISIFLSAVSDYRGGKLYFTTEYIQAVKYSKMNSFIRSIKYSFIAGIGASVIGLLLSYFIDRRKLFGLQTLDFITALPYIIPGTFFGIGYILAFNDYPLTLTGTGAIVVINCIYRQLPISTKAGSAVLSNMNPEIENAAKDLGTPNIKIIKDIIFPLLKPAFLISFINTFTATMTTVGAIIFLVTPGAKTATIEMFNTLRDGDYGLGAVLASMIIIFTLMTNLIFTKILLKDKNL